MIYFSLIKLINQRPAKQIQVVSAMEFDFLNEIISGSVASLFKPQPLFTIDRKNPLNGLNAGQSSQISKITSPSQLTSSTTSKVGAANMKKSWDGMSKSTDQSVVDSEVNLSRDDQNIFRSPNPTIHMSVEFSGSIKSKQFEDNRQSLKELPNKQTDNRQSPFQPTTVQSINASIGGNKSTTSSISDSLEPKQTRSTEPPTLEQWITVEGPRRLEESLKKLKLDTNKINKANLEGLPVDELQAQKKAVKNELKLYDAAFFSYYKKQPERREKEAMRPLYVYYKKLKQYISKATEESKDEEKKSGSTSATTPNSYSISQRSSGSFDNKQVSIGSLRGDVSKSGNVANIITNNTKGQQLQSNKSNTLGAGTAKPKEGENLKKKLEDLKAERNQLREKLHNYQTEFTRNNNRKIRYHKDIEPVEADYKRYKDIKSEIAKLEAALQQ